MTNTKLRSIDLLVDGGEDELLTVSLNMGDTCLQWTALPAHGLSAIREVLDSAPGTISDLKIGTVFNVPLYLVEREGIFSLKVTTEAHGSDLIRIDLPEEAVPILLEELADAIEVWET